eukprot:CAMPEP_0113961362 /NCGR_PEP_ID=MMETSP0011_2-20120614/5260_1 /TAXON_ID=101924 /ORGANISM="Rhodosorus marinus" /LENGTH=349 /DNA_ID=CAMNT_0000972981 /DNA_START=341 /DNA_END=1393 /DNA_ORIENTATION=+ /assembly_acc=CAM_ASM_000156
MSIQLELESAFKVYRSMENEGTSDEAATKLLDYANKSSSLMVVAHDGDYVWLAYEGGALKGKVDLEFKLRKDDQIVTLRAASRRSTQVYAFSAPSADLKALLTGIRQDLGWEDLDKDLQEIDRMSCTWPYSRIAKTSHNKNERVPRNPRGKRRKSSEISAMERQWLLSFPELNIVIDRRRECRHSCASNCHLSSPCPRANLRSRRRRHGRASDATRINSIPNIVLRSNLLDRALRPRVDHPESRETPGVAAHGLGSGSEPYAQLLPGRALEINGFINSVRVASEEEAEETPNPAPATALNPDLKTHDSVKVSMLRPAPGTAAPGTAAPGTPATPDTPASKLVDASTSFT